MDGCIYRELPEGEPDAIIAVCDTKDRGVDYCVMPIAYQYGQNYYIEDVVCDNSTKDGECNLYAEGWKYTAFCDLENCNERKPSNADRIRVMTDEELADYLRWHNDLYSRNGLDWLDWLRKECDDTQH